MLKAAAKYIVNTRNTALKKSSLHTL